MRSASDIALQHFVFHRVPDPAVQLDEAWRQADLVDVPRTRRIDGELADQARRAPTVRDAAIKPNELQAGEDAAGRPAPGRQRFGLEHVTGVAIDAGEGFAQNVDAAR